MSIRTIGWLLNPRDRATLLAMFPPRWPDVIAHHVTLAFKVPDPLPEPTLGKVVGHVDDGAGLEALVVAIADTVDRPDGSVYHITWSLDRARDREARESNDVLAEQGWTPIDTPVLIRLTPSVLG